MTRWIKSGMTSTVRVTFLDGSDPITVRSSAGEAVAYERQFKVKFQDGVGAESILWIAWRAARRQGLTSEAQFDQFLRMMQGGAQFGGGYQQSQGGGGWQQAQRGPTLEDACNVLGVKPDDDATTIKRAYRKLMSEHHPDKLVAKGLPPEMMEMAKQKAQEIQKAYELIKEQKGFK